MILAIDIGTSTVKGALFSDSGAVEGLHRVAVAMGADLDPAVHESSPAEWVRAVREICSRLLPGRGGLDALAISGNGPTLLPVDAEGEALHPALTWMDRRAQEEAKELSAAVGFPVDSSFSLPKALWFKRRRPEIYARTAAFLSCPEYLVRVLTGETMSIVPEGYEKHYGDSETLELLGLDREKFPVFARPGGLAGASTAAGERRTGLPRGTRVVASGPDFLAALIGTATTRPGRACDRSGTSEGINLCALRGVRDRRLLSVPHVIPPYANISGTVSASGKAVDWFKEASGRGGEDFEVFFDDIRQAPPGADRLIFLPYLSGERAPMWDPLARGVFIGLTLAHGGREMSRAVVESTAFAMRDIIEVMEESGALVKELRITGRPGRNAVWNQIKADITGRPLLLPRFEDAELLGDLCFALVALGRHRDAAEAAEELVKIDRVFEPDSSLKSLYDELFSAYRAAYGALKPIFGRLNDIPGAERNRSWR